MLKKRIIPLMLLKDSRLVKGQCFSSYRDVGDPVKSAMVYSDQDADELMLLNLDGATGLDRLLKILPKLTESVFMPLSLGGGISSFEHAARLIECGADKVVVNSSLYQNPTLIEDISKRYGVQAMVASIDVKYVDGDYNLYSSNGTVKESICLKDHVQQCIDNGAGEIVIQNIDKDGSMLGFDIQLAKLVHDMSTVPVVLASGCGDYSHISDAFSQSHVSAVACGSLFNFSDSSPIRAKSYLSNYGVPYKQQ